jgi:hypothetical protein
MMVAGLLATDGAGGRPSESAFSLLVAYFLLPSQPYSVEH